MSEYGNLIMIFFLFLLIVCDFPVVRAVTCRARDDDSDKHDEYTSFEETSPVKPLNVQGKCNKNDWSRTYSLSQGDYVYVDCGRCTVHTLDVRARTRAKRKPSECWGLTPELFSSHKQCYFKAHCYLKYTPSVIVWLPPQVPKDRGCLGDQPSSLDVGHSCLDTDEVPIDDVVKDFQAVESVIGLVRSHNYDLKNRYPYQKYNSRNIMEISPPENFTLTSSLHYVLVSVLDADINHGDKFTMRDKIHLSADVDLAGRNQSCQVTNWIAGEMHNITATTLQLELLLDSQPQRHGLGFAICFQWFDAADRTAAETFKKTVDGCKKVIGTEFPTFYMIQDVITQKYKGMVRSHSKYPWNYPRPSLDSSDDTVYRWSSNCHVLRAPNNFSHLAIFVESISLERRDSLRICGGNTVVSDKELREGTSHNFTSQTVTLNFTVFQSLQHTNSGFILCYQWFSPHHHIPLRNPCEKYKYQVHPCGAGDEETRTKLKDKCGVVIKKRGKKDKRGKQSIKRKQL